MVCIASFSREFYSEGVYTIAGAKQVGVLSERRVVCCPWYIHCRIGASEMAMVLVAMMSLAILAGIAIYVLCLQNYFDHFTDVALICRNIDRYFLFMAYRFYFTNI